MPRPEDEELERRYRDLFENEVVRSVVDARTPNHAAPVDEDAILDFVRTTDRGHADYVKSVFRRLGDADPSA